MVVGERVGFSKPPVLPRERRARVGGLATRAGRHKERWARSLCRGGHSRCSPLVIGGRVLGSSLRDVRGSFTPSHSFSSSMVVSTGVVDWPSSFVGFDTCDDIKLQLAVFFFLLLLLRRRQL